MISLDSFLRKALSIYRTLLYKLCGRISDGIINQSVPVHVESFRNEENHGDIVHPCVRYIPEGFEGHHWWMVYTPYYAADAAVENPILCFADENSETPPTEWKVYCLVNEKPVDGYNSDPTLLFVDGKLYVYWRENIVSNKEKYNFWRATFVAQVGEGVVKKCTNIPVLQTEDDEIDTETCPTFFCENDESFTAYAMHLQFHSKKVKKLSGILKRIVNVILLVTDMLGIYAQQKHFGIAIWKGNSPMEPFIHTKTVKFNNCNRLYRPWHMDFFDYQGIRYAIVQTNMSNADLCLAESSDKEHFSFFNKPIITNKSIDKVGIYKPCAGVTKNGMFYLYYTAQDNNNRSLNRLYFSEMPFQDLLLKIK